MSAAAAKSCTILCLYKYNIYIYINIIYIYIYKYNIYIYIYMYIIYIVVSFIILSYLSFYYIHIYEINIFVFGIEIINQKKLLPFQSLLASFRILNIWWLEVSVNSNYNGEIYKNPLASKEKLMLRKSEDKENIKNLYGHSLQIAQMTVLVLLKTSSRN